MAGLVHGRHLLFLVVDDHGAALRAHHDLVLGELEVHHADDLLVVARGVERRLVHQVGQIGAGEARRAAGEDVDVHVVAERNLLGVDGEDALAALHVRTVDDDAAVEAARAEERRVEDVGPVGGRDEDDALVRLEAVHLHEELVEGLLALVVPAAEAGAAVAADGVDFVDEDDAGGVLLALLEEVADARGADADEHLDEVRAADREEGDVGFAGDGAGEERLAGARGAHEEHALRDAAAKLLELLRFLEELDDFLEFFLGLVDAGDVLEGDLFLGARGELRAALAEREGLVPAALHLPHDEDPEADHQQDGRPVVEDGGPGARRGVAAGDGDAVFGEEVTEAFVLRDRVGAKRDAVGTSRDVLALDLVAGYLDLGNFLIGDFLQEGRERDLLGTPVQVRGEIPDQYRDNDEDHPEEQALEGRIQPWPPNRLAFKNITACEAPVIRKSSDTDSPTTHTILSALSTTRGRESRSFRATFLSTRRSWSFFSRPPIPSGLSRSPGRRDRTASGSVNPSAATACSSRGHSSVTVPFDCPRGQSQVGGPGELSRLSVPGAGWQKLPTPGRRGRPLLV